MRSRYWFKISRSHCTQRMWPFQRRRKKKLFDCSIPNVGIRRFDVRGEQVGHHFSFVLVFPAQKKRRWHIEQRLFYVITNIRFNLNFISLIDETVFERFNQYIYFFIYLPSWVLWKSVATDLSLCSRGLEFFDSFDRLSCKPSRSVLVRLRLWIWSFLPGVRQLRGLKERGSICE